MVIIAFFFLRFWVYSVFGLWRFEMEEKKREGERKDVVGNWMQEWGVVVETLMAMEGGGKAIEDLRNRVRRAETEAIEAALDRAMERMGEVVRGR